VLDNSRYNSHNQTKDAFFYLFECEPDPQAAHGLFDSAFAWARGRGLNRILGPRGFTALDGLGLLVKDSSCALHSDFHIILHIMWN